MLGNNHKDVPITERLVRATCLIQCVLIYTPKVDVRKKDFNILYHINVLNYKGFSVI